MNFKYSSIGIFGKPGDESLGSTIFSIIEAISKIDDSITIYLESETAKFSKIESPNKSTKNHIHLMTINEMKNSIELAIVIGGDGTLLGIARKLATYGTHLIGINQGRLGFTTDLDIRDILIELPPLILGKGVIEKRDMLNVSIVRKNKKKIEEKIFNVPALNDAVVNRGAISNMVELDVFVANQYLQTIRGDGLIVCTPTGSTAYALSASGPIIHPMLPSIALVPIAPQALSSRPIMLPLDLEIQIFVKNGRGTILHCDMQTVAELNDEDIIKVKQSELKVNLLHPKHYDYFSVLRKKLNWSANPTWRKDSN